ncbi:MAG: hypothetical protein M3198_00790 [Actinomycetota bacterium]|nr:hypothetical protein [Actinomycetota bacterium]
MLSARRAYSDSVKWVKSARPRRLRRLGFAERAVGATVAAAVPLLTLISLLSPGSFGSPASNTLRSGWPLYVLLGLLAISCIYLFGRRAHIRWSLARVREPFVRAPEGEASYENAADALAACPGPMKTRFALWWVWGPVVVAVLAVMAGFSAVYFLIDAILARFDVGWGHPVFAAANLAISFVLFALVSGRLVTWRLALAVHRSVTVGY